MKPTRQNKSSKELFNSPLPFHLPYRELSFLQEKRNILPRLETN